MSAAKVLKNLYRVDPQARIAAIRKGIPAAMVAELSATMGMSKELLLGSLGLSRATISRKEKDDTALSKDESERVLGVASLIGKAQAMVEESGDPTGFDANDLSGAGAKNSGGRWNSIGTPLIYSATNIALATIETVVYLRNGSLPFNRLLDLRPALSPLISCRGRFAPHQIHPLQTNAH